MMRIRNAPRRDYSKYSIKHRRGVRREIGGMDVLPSVLVDIIAAYTQDDVKLKRMRDNLMDRLRLCRTVHACKMTDVINKYDADVITVAVCVDNDDSDVDYWIVTTNRAYPRRDLSIGWLKLSYPSKVLDMKRIHNTCLASLRNAGGVEDDEGRVWIEGRDE